MSNSLYTDLAPYYDLIVQKNTEKETDFLESELIKGSTLDIGCGTGRHTCKLLSRGFKVVGIDKSQEILKQAREKCDAKFIQGDIKHVDLDYTFDNAIIMWSTINMFKKTEINKILSNVSKHLKEGGILIIDSKKYPGRQTVEEKRTVENEDVEIEIKSERIYEDKIRESTYKYVLRKKGESKVTKYKDEEEIYFYNPSEFREMLKENNFSVKKLFGNYEGDKYIEDKERMIFKAEKDSNIIDK